MASIGLALTAEYVNVPPPPTFQELYSRHSATVYRTALRATGNSADAEDVLQNVFLRLMHQPASAEGFSEAYLRRAATNASIDIIRSKCSRRESPLDSGPERTTPAATVLLKETLRRALASVDPEDAQLFLLRNLEGFSYEELAEMFRIERGTVASRLHRIRQVLLAEVSK